MAVQLPHRDIVISGGAELTYCSASDPSAGYRVLVGALAGRVRVSVFSDVIKLAPGDYVAIAEDGR